MNIPLEFSNRLRTVFILIEECINNDNIIKEEEFQRIQSLKRKLQISSEDIYNHKKQDIERILYLQFFLLLLDDKVDATERKEVEYYREIFGYSEDEVLKIETKVKADKTEWPQKQSYH